MIVEEKIEKLSSLDFEEFYKLIDENYRKKYYGVQDEN